MKKIKVIDPRTAEDRELSLVLTPYQIINTVYSFLADVKTPEHHLWEEMKEEFSESYEEANLVLGDGTQGPDTIREQFLASTFFVMGMKMGNIQSAWPVGELAMEAVTKAKAPQVNGGKKAPWKIHQSIILQVIGEYESNNNKLKLRKDPTKITQADAIKKISDKTNLTVVGSTFNSWLTKYRENDGNVFF